MKITINKSELMSKLSTAAKYTADNKIRPIINCVKLCANVDNITLMATDLENSIIVTAQGTIENQGTVCFEPIKVLEYVSTLDDTSINIETENNILKIYEAEFPTQTAEDFPNIKDNVDNSKEITLDIETFIDTVSKLLPISVNAKDNLQMYGIRVEIIDKKINFVATDSFRMTRIEKYITAENTAFTLPHQSAKLMIETLKQHLGDFKLYKSDSNITFEVAGTKVLSRIITLEFPNYKSILSGFAYDKTAIVNRKELIKILKRVLVFAKDNMSAKNGITLELSRNTINIRTISERGKAKDKLEAIYTGDNMKIALNAQFILDYLNGLTSEVIEIRLNKSFNPIMMLPENKNDNVFLTMPLALAE